MSTTPPIIPRSTSLPPAAMQAGLMAEGEGRWMHELRNELNTAMMAAAAARRLLQDGEAEEALANVRRTEAACYRCAQLLRRDQDPLTH